jgi:hypothetical protein
MELTTRPSAPVAVIVTGYLPMPSGVPVIVAVEMALKVVVGLSARAVGNPAAVIVIGATPPRTLMFAE